MARKRSEGTMSGETDSVISTTPDAGVPPSYTVTVRGKLHLRDLIAAGRTAGVPVSARMAGTSLNELPVELTVGLIAVLLRREALPGATYDQALTLVDEGRVELIWDLTDPKSTASTTT